MQGHLPTPIFLTSTRAYLRIQLLSTAELSYSCMTGFFMVWENSLINGVLKGGVGVCFPDDCLGFFVSMYDVCVHQPEPPCLLTIVVMTRASCTCQPPFFLQTNMTYERGANQIHTQTNRSATESLPCNLCTYVAYVHKNVSTQ